MMRARALGRRVEERQHVLQLVAIAKRAARLVEAGATEYARRQALIQQPAIEHDVHRGLGRLDADVVEHAVPERVQRRPRRVDAAAIAISRDERQRLVATFALCPEHEVRLEFFARSELECTCSAAHGSTPGVDATPTGPTARALRDAR